jgi:DnaJ-class molecular chaperone
MDITNCEVCNGNGVINRIMQTPIGVIQQSFLVIIVMVLVVRLLIMSDCNGTGSKSIEEIIEVVSPPGIRKIVHLLCMERSSD